VTDADLSKLVGALNSQSAKTRSLEKIVDEMKSLLQAAHAVPKHIEDIPGVRVPWQGVIDIAISANSTSRFEGTLTLSSDGPYIVTGLALFWRRTSGAYQGYWTHATTAGLKIAPASQQLGFGGLFDQPLVSSFDVEIEVTDSGRNWQNMPFSSALFNPAVGGAYIFPVAHLLGTNAIVKVHVTPTVSQTVSGVVQAIFLGYKVVQGPVYQP
jgi:hypothetical protein